MDKFNIRPASVVINTKEQQADLDLKKILNRSSDLETDYSGSGTTKWGTLPGTKLRRPSTGSMSNLSNISNGSSNGTLSNGGRQVHAYRHSVHIETSPYGGEGEDEILESLVRSTTQQPLRANERMRRSKARYGDRKSCKC